MMLRRRDVVVGVICIIRRQDTHCKYVSSDLFSCFYGRLLFFRGGQAEGGTKKTWLFSPSSWSSFQRLSPSSKASFPSKYKFINNLTQFYRLTQKHKDMKYLTLFQPPSSQLSLTCRIFLPGANNCHFKAHIWVSVLENKNFFSSFSSEKKQKEKKSPISPQQCIQEKWCCYKQW